MADFIVKRPVFLHGRVYKPGNEEALQEAGFTPSDKRRYERRGQVDYHREAPGVSATPGALDLAEVSGVDIADVVGSGPDGRITKRDVEKALSGPRPSDEADQKVDSGEADGDSDNN